MSQWKNLADALLTNHLRLISSSVIRHIDISSVQLLSSVRFFATPWTAAHQAFLSVNNCLNLLQTCPSSRWCHPTISSSVIPFSSRVQSFPASGSFPMSQFFTSGGQSIGASISASTFQWLFRTDFLQDWLVWSPCCPRDSQESSPTPQFKSINSLALSFLHSSTLTSIHDYWKNHNFD